VDDVENERASIVRMIMAETKYINGQQRLGLRLHRLLQNPILLSTLVVFAVGCTFGKRDSATRTEGAPVTVVNPLSVRVAQPDLLTSVNSLYIAEPTLVGDARRSSVDVKQVYALVEDSAQQELGMKIVSLRNPNANAANGAGRAMGSSTSIIPHGVDSILRTEIMQYDERVGSSVGGDPAAVSFSMAVTRVRDGAEIWQGTFSFRQQPLSENLLKLGDRLGPNGSGAGWNSARDILDRGVLLALKDLSARREQLFLGRKVIN